MRGAVVALRNADGDGPFPRDDDAAERPRARLARAPDEPKQRAQLFTELSALAAAVLDAASPDALRNADLAAHLDFVYVWLTSRVPGDDADAVPRLLEKIAAALGVDGDEAADAAVLERFAARARLLRRPRAADGDDDDEL